MSFVDTLMIGGAAAAGTFAGWLLRGRRHLTERRTLAELYMRKVRLAEQDQEKAIRALNQNLVEMRSFQGTIEGLQAEAERHEAAAQTAEKALFDTKEVLERRTAERKAALAEGDSLREELVSFRKAGEEALVRDRAEDVELAEARESLADAAAEEAALRKELEDRSAELEEAAAALAAALEAQAVAAAEAEAVTAGRDALLAERDRAREEVEELSERLQQAAEAERLLAARDAALAGKEEKLAELRERLEELAPYPERLRAAEETVAAIREERDEREATLTADFAQRLEASGEDARRSIDDWEARLGTALEEKRAAVEALEQRLSEREERIAHLELRTAELGPLPEALAASEAAHEEAMAAIQAEHEAVLVAIRAENESALTASEAARTGSERTIGELRVQVAELSTYPARLRETEERLAAREKEWREDERGLTSANEERVQSVRDGAREEQARLERELAERDANLATLERRLSESQVGFATERDRLERELSASRSRLTELEALPGELDLARKREAILEGKVTEERARTAAVEADLQASRNRVDELEPIPLELDEERQRGADLREVLEQERARAAGAEEQLAALRQAEEVQRAHLAAEKEGLAKLTANHQSVLGKVEKMQGRVEVLEGKVKERDLAVREGAKALRERERELKALDRRAERAEAALEKALAGGPAPKAPKSTEKGASKGVLKPVPRVATATPKASPKTAASRDQLQELPGVGPALEKRLRSAGCKSYADIAGLDRAGIEALAEKVGVSAQVIRREKWVATAKRLHKAKYGE